MQFREVIRPPLWLVAFIYFMLLSLVIAIWAAFDNHTALYALIAATALTIWISVKAKREISIDDRELRVGRAHIEREYCGEVKVLGAQEMRNLRTRGADPAAFLALTFWISTGVQIEVRDERDRTPYWLISTRRGEEIKRTLYR